MYLPNALLCLRDCADVYNQRQPWAVIDRRTHIVVVFQGTKTAKQMLTDAQAWTVEFPFGSGIRIHAGFEADFKQLWPDILRAIIAIDPNAVRPVVIIGHSLGGALAARAAWAMPNPIHAIYTFGQPRVWNRAGADAFDHQWGNRTFRFVAKLDIVPRVPFLLGTYRHHLNEILLTDDGHYVDDPTIWTRITYDLRWLVTGWIKRKFMEIDELLQDHHIATSYLPMMENLK